MDSLVPRAFHGGSRAHLAALSALPPAAPRSPSHLATGPSSQRPYLLLSPPGALTLTMGAVNTETLKRTLTNTVRMSGVGKGMGSIVRAALGSTGRQEGGQLPAT